MSVYNKFYCFVADAPNKVHNLGSDSLKVALTNVTPVNTNTVLANLTEISYTNISSRVITVTSSTQTTGLYKLILAALTLTATGTVGPFQYVVVYNDTSTNKSLIGWYDIGYTVTLGNTDTFVCNFDTSNGYIQLT